MMLLFFISRNFGKLVKNVKEYKTKLYFTVKVSVIKVGNTLITDTLSDRVIEPLKFRRYVYFRQVVLSAKCLFDEKSAGKLSVRQIVFRQNVFRQGVIRQGVIRQNVRPPCAPLRELHLFVLWTFNIFFHI